MERGLLASYEAQVVPLTFEELRSSRQQVQVMSILRVELADAGFELGVLEGGAGLQEGLTLHGLNHRTSAHGSCCPCQGRDRRTMDRGSIGLETMLLRAWEGVEQDWLSTMGELDKPGPGKAQGATAHLCWSH